MNFYIFINFQTVFTRDLEKLIVISLEWVMLNESMVIRRKPVLSLYIIHFTFSLNLKYKHPDVTALSHLSLPIETQNSNAEFLILLRSFNWTMFRVFTHSLRKRLFNSFRSVNNISTSPFPRFHPSKFHGVSFNPVANRE